MMRWQLEYVMPESQTFTQPNWLPLVEEKSGPAAAQTIGVLVLVPRIGKFSLS